MKKVTCRHCHGKGIIPRFIHIQDGKCFSCKGKGFFAESELRKERIRQERIRQEQQRNIDWQDGAFSEVIEKFKDNPRVKNGFAMIDNFDPSQLCMELAKNAGVWDEIRTRHGG